MASSQFTMRRYLVEPKRGLMVNLAICAAEHIKRYGVPPTVCHVSKLLRDVPAQIGPIRIEQAWGVFPHEIDLGVEPVAEASGA
jgi:hypothetical protein